jgi:hypothetical protein
MGIADFNNSGNGPDPGPRNDFISTFCMQINENKNNNYKLLGTYFSKKSKQLMRSGSRSVLKSWLWVPPETNKGMEWGYFSSDLP